MLPSSDDLEVFYGLVRELDLRLAKLKGAEVRRANLLQALAEASKRWIRLSQGLHQVESIDQDELELRDEALQEVLAATSRGNRVRGSTYRLKLAVVMTGFTEKVVVPLIKFEGSPAQVAARQLESTFEGVVSPDEESYIDEAARCVAARCYRASLIMLWAAAVARLHRTIESVGFAAFNAAVAATSKRKADPFRRASGSEVNSLPELQKLRDFDLIVVGMELWRYDLSVFQELERLLGIRNSAAHPGMSQPTTMDVQQFAAKLSDVVFKRIGRQP